MTKGHEKEMLFRKIKKNIIICVYITNYSHFFTMFLTPWNFQKNFKKQSLWLKQIFFKNSDMFRS